MVDSMSECPSHCCTVLRSTPAHRQRVAKVERNLCSQQSSLSSLARSAHAFRQSKKSSFGLQPAVGNTKPHVLSAVAFHAFSFFTNFSGIGISRSLYAFGVQFRSALWLTRTVLAAKFTSDQYVCITSCSRIPVIRKNSYQSCSSGSQALKSLSSSSCSYISGSSSVYRGQSFLPTNPRIPFRFRNDISVSNLL